VPVEVRIPTMMREDAGGQASVHANGETVGKVLEDLVLQFPRLKGKLVTDEGALHKFVNVYLDDDDVRYLQKLDTKVADGQQISIIPAVAGG
jgi:molybdopterin synthase sulfur carrier subunit